jgi:hypothetical protein
VLADQDQAHRLRDLDRNRLDRGALLIVIQPVEPSIGREYIGRVFAICVLGGLGSLPGTLIGAMLVGIVESLTSTFYGPSWAPAVAMAGLSQVEVAEIVALLIKLNERGVTIILIEHIMRAVMRFSQRLVVLVSGAKIADGAPDEVIRDPDVERAYLGQ